MIDPNIGMLRASRIFLHSCADQQIAICVSFVIRLHQRLVETGALGLSHLLDVVRLIISVHNLVTMPRHSRPL